MVKSLVAISAVCCGRCCFCFVVVASVASGYSGCESGFQGMYQEGSTVLLPIMVKQQQQQLAGQQSSVYLLFFSGLSPHFVHIFWAGPLGVARNGPAIREEAAPAGA